MATQVNLETPLVYDPRYMDFDYWASLMSEQYAAQQLSIPMPGMNWQDWAAGLLAIDVFTNQAAPNPYQFDDWQEWASMLLNVMNGGR